MKFSRWETQEGGDTSARIDMADGEPKVFVSPRKGKWLWVAVLLSEETVEEGFACSEAEARDAADDWLRKRQIELTDEIYHAVN